jgi:ClpP class serine protease
MSFKTLSTIMRGGWYIRESYVGQNLPLLAAFMRGRIDGGQFFTGNAEFEQPFVMKDGKRYAAYKRQWNDVTKSVDTVPVPELWPDNCTAVIPVIGPIMKYNGDCGETGNVLRMMWANDLVSTGKISKLTSWVDSPGGQADGTPQYADFIKSLDIPTVAYVDGGAYSAGAWISSAHDQIIVANSMTEFGSIGAYTTYIDWSGYLKKMGVKVTQKYAEQSSLKNDFYRKAQDGDLSGYQQMANECAAAFIDAFAQNRGDKLKGDAWNTGKDFSAQEALDLGLVDRIGSFADATAPYKSKSHTVNPSNSNTNTMKFENLTALAGTAEVTEEQIDKANGDLTETGITNVTLVRESFIQEAADLSAAAANHATELEAANAATASVQTQLEAANATIAANATTIADLNARIEVFGNQGSNNHHTPKGNNGSSDSHSDVQADADAQALIDNLPHNKKADSMGYGK